MDIQERKRGAHALAHKTGCRRMKSRETSTDRQEEKAWSVEQNTWSGHALVRMVRYRKSPLQNLEKKTVLNQSKLKGTGASRKNKKPKNQDQVSRSTTNRNKYGENKIKIMRKQEKSPSSRRGGGWKQSGTVCSRKKKQVKVRVLPGAKAEKIKTRPCMSIHARRTYGEYVKSVD